MKAEDCTIGTIVFLKENHFPLQRGLIAGPLSVNEEMEPNIIVEWGQEDYITRVPIEELLSEEEYKLAELAYKAKMAKIDHEFDLLTSKVNEKMMQAAALISECAQIASSHDRKLSDMYNTVQPLLTSMNLAGWKTSSMRC